MLLLRQRGIPLQEDNMNIKRIIMLSMIMSILAGTAAFAGGIAETETEEIQASIAETESSDTVLTDVVLDFSETAAVTTTEESTTLTPAIVQLTTTYQQTSTEGSGYSHTNTYSHTVQHTNTVGQTPPPHQGSQNGGRPGRR